MFRGETKDWRRSLWVRACRFQQQMQSQVDNPSQSSPRAAPPRKAPVRSVQQDELRRQVSRMRLEGPTRLPLKE